MTASGAFQTQGAPQNSICRLPLSHLERVVGGASRPMFSPGYLAARSSRHRLDVQIWRTATGWKVQAVLCVEPLGDDGYTISIPA